MPRMIRAYGDLEDGKEIVHMWHAANKKRPKSNDKSKAKSKDDSTTSARRSGFSQPRTDTNFKLVVGVDTIDDLLDCPKIFEHRKPLLPDWAITDVPSEMQRFHSWYVRACRLGLRTYALCTILWYLDL
jgi:hypothetical protein